MDKKIVLQQLLLLQDDSYYKFIKNLIPGTDNIIGIRIPILRKFAKNLINNNWQEYLDASLPDRDAYHEETILQGLIIAGVKMNNEKRLALIEKYLAKISNWAQCDIFCSALKVVKRYPDRYWNFIESACHSSEPYTIRFVVVTLLTYYTDDTYSSKALELLQSIHHDNYYVKMSVAWAISIFYIKQQTLTMPILLNKNLDKFVHNKAIQKICESFRVSAEDKALLKTLRRTV